MKQTSEIIRALREDADLDQSEVAHHLGIPQQTYSNYERGKYEFPARHLLPLAQLYHVNVEYLLGATDYRASLERLNLPYTEGMSIGALVSSLMKLDPDSRQTVLDFVEFLVTKKAAQ